MYCFDVLIDSRLIIVLIWTHLLFLHVPQPQAHSDFSHCAWLQTDLISLISILLWRLPIQPRDEILTLDIWGIQSTSNELQWNDPKVFFSLLPPCSHREAGVNSKIGNAPNIFVQLVKKKKKNIPIFLGGKKQEELNHKNRYIYPFHKLVFLFSLLAPFKMKLSLLWWGYLHFFYLISFWIITFFISSRTIKHGVYFCFSSLLGFILHV